MTIPASLKSHRDASVNTSTRENEGQEAARELWAALALATVKQQIYRLAAADSSNAPHAPRPTGDGKLTFGCASVDGLPDTDVEADAVGGSLQGVRPERAQVTIELDGGRLGIVHLTLSRHGQAVSVLVGVRDPVQRALVELELPSLRQALTTAGLSVGSVQVIHPDKAGIALAQGRRVMNPQSTQSVSSAYRSLRSRQETDAEEGLDVVG